MKKNEYKTNHVKFWYTSACRRERLAKRLYKNGRFKKAAVEYSLAASQYGLAGLYDKEKVCEWASMVSLNRSESKRQRQPR